MNYLIHILIMMETYILLALSYNLLLGYCGLFSLAHAAFYGIGAYISTLLMIKLGFNYFLTIPFVIVGVSIIALIIASPSLRLKGDYFMLATISFQTLIFSILYNWVDLTRGPYGIPGIPSPKILGYTITGVYNYFFFALIIVCISVLIFYRLYNSSFGLVLKSIRDNEVLSISIGKDVNRFKNISFVIAGIFAAIAGTLYATYVSYIDPTSFTLDESVYIMTMVIVGGSGNMKGPLVGVLFMITIPELLRFIGLPDSVAANLRQMIYAAMLILVMRYRPQGLFGEYSLE